MIGQTISHYKILEKLGEGGMGVVYKARDTKLDRPVALKFLPQQITVSAEDKARFLQEAKAASAVMHPNVCVIHDIAEHEGQQFIVMEYVDGKTLRQMVPIQKIQDAIDYAIQIGEALQEAHSKGVVHRDVKADNIMVNSRNQVKVADFGLAKLKGSLKLTKTSSTVGTLAYMSPEQIQGGAVDARSDIFSFGVVLYEMLTGRVPFRGDYEAAIIYSIVNEEPEPIQKYMTEAPSELVHILNRALEKDPEDRYQTVQEMVIELRRLKKDTSKRIHSVPSAQEIGSDKISGKTHGFLRKHGMLAGFVLMGVLVVVGVLYFLLNRPSKFVANRVVVAVFENRTGEPSLDWLGTFITESVAQGLAGVGSVDVLPSDVGIRTWQGLVSRNERSDKSDLLKPFGRRMGAKLVVSGAYYKEGDSLRIHARVTDSENGKLVKVVGPVSSTLANRSAALETVQQRLMGGIDSFSGPAMIEFGQSTPDYVPRYDSYREMQVGMEFFLHLDYDNSIPYFRHAFQLDSIIFTSKLFETIAYANGGRSAQADSIIKYLDKYRLKMTRMDMLFLDWIRYAIQGNRAGELNISRQLSSLMPKSWAILYMIGYSAFSINRQHEAIRALSKINPYDSTAFRAWVSYWDAYSHAYHLLGEHKQELKKAREGRAQYTNLYDSYWYEMRALAALGRTEEIWKLVNEVSTLPPQRGWTPGDILLACAGELRCHGFHEAYRQAVEKSIEWHTSRPDSEQQLVSRKTSLARSYYAAEQWDKAKVFFEALNKKFPDNLDYIGYLGAISARTGDIREAKRIAEFFKNLNRPYLYGNHTFWRACIHSLLGEKEEAVQLLREALAQGEWYNSLHANMDLEPLRDYPPFQELIRPKD